MTEYSATRASVSLKEILAHSQEIMSETRELLELSKRLTFEQRLTVTETQAVLAESYVLLRQTRQENRADRAATGEGPKSHA